MREESIYLRHHAQARAAVKEIVEMPDHQIDRVLRSIEQNAGKLSNVLAKEMPVLREPGVWESIVEAASRVLGEAAVVDESVVERYRPERTPGR
jgi:hypothetical protein